MKVHIGSGSLVVEEPDESLYAVLQRFKRHKNGSGEYEPLYSASTGGSHRTLVTLPGFADRIRNRFENDAVFVNRKVPLPEPNMADALKGMDDCWRATLEKGVKKGGGVMAVPEILGAAETAAVILKAYPHDALCMRGTPLSVVVSGDPQEARPLMRKLRRLVPYREVGVDSDDIIVTGIGGIKNIPIWDVGILIVLMNGGCMTNWVEDISSIRHAARWAIFETDTGVPPKEDMLCEGLFGPLSATVSYTDAVKAGVAKPVTVCWLAAPVPPKGVGYGPENLQVACATCANPAFCETVADIMRRTPDEMGCVCRASRAVASKIAAGMPGVEVAQYGRNMSQKESAAMRENIESGAVRRVLLSGDLPIKPHSVMIMATCEGRHVVENSLPWGAADGTEAFIVDFIHSWDVHNGQPGYLARNDTARNCRYKELGFRQMFLESVDRLPFIGG